MSELASPSPRSPSSTPVNCNTSTNTQQPETSSAVSVSAQPTSASSQSQPSSAPASPSLQPQSGKSAADTPPRSCILRLQSDYKAIEADPPEGVSASPIDSNLTQWKACIFGPSDTEWEGGVFQMIISFPKEYPQKPPSVRFVSKMFHPNVFHDGSLCLDIIQDHWSPIHTVSTILTSIQSLLTDPNPASPANPEAARLWASDKKEYRKRVRACVAKSTS